MHSLEVAHIEPSFIYIDDIQSFKVNIKEFESKALPQHQILLAIPFKAYVLDFLVLEA